jgi:hypothetical protein
VVLLGVVTDDIVDLVGADTNQVIDQRFNLCGVDRVQQGGFFAALDR